MLRKVIYFTLIAALYSCGKDEPDSPAAQDPAAVDYLFTRADTSPPAEGTAYTFISYNRNGDGSFGPNPDGSGNQKPVGHYAYMGNPAYKGILQPCTVDAGGAFVSGPTPANGQALYDGLFRTVCVHPAITLTAYTDPSGDTYRLIRFRRGDEVYISEPFDMNIDGYTLVALPEKNDGEGLPLHDIRSKVVFDIVRGNTTTNFAVNGFTLENAGAWGWYCPATQKTRIGYIDAEPDNIYDKDYNPTPGNSAALAVSPDGRLPSEGGYDLYYDASATAVGGIVYTTGYGADNGFFFFSNDYVTDTYLTPRLAIDMSFDGDSYQTMRIPLGIGMVGGMRYRFRLTVYSSSIRATFRVIPWAGDDDPGGTIGGPAEEIPLGTWTVDGWQPGNGGRTEGIGGDIP